MADQEVAAALGRSFLGRLPRDVVDELIAEGQRTDYPAGSTIALRLMPRERRKTMSLPSTK